jgi:para-nitrobenzyl esterase
MQWDGTKQATVYAPGCLQLAGGKTNGSEDCLNLNIWRPADNGSKLPVLVFVHGGGNMTGSSKEFPGDVLAANTNSIIISIEYRLGAMGFLHHPALLTGDDEGDSGNFGLLDILQSLKWVKENIADFGGDANNVTLSGQSAGGRDVMAALISPLGKGLFERAFVLSGGMTTASTAEGDVKSEAALLQIAIADGHGTDEASARNWLASQTAERLAAYMRSIPADKLVTAFGSTAIRMEPFPHLFRDGKVIPQDGFAAIAAGSYTKVPMILGSTATEFSAFAFGDPAFSASINDGSLFKDEKKAAQYAAAVKYGSELYSGFNVERAAEQLAKVSDQPPVYAYRFAWGEQDGVISADLQKLLGATHGSDMAFVTGENIGIATYFPQGYFSEQNAPGRAELVSAIHEYVQNFLYTGNPGSVEGVAWTPWQAEANAERILRLDASNEHADIAMSTEYLKKEDVLARMERELAQNQDTLKLLKENVLAGRFFW